MFAGNSYRNRFAFQKASRLTCGPGCGGFKDSSDPSHFIFEIDVGRSRIQHWTTLNPYWHISEVLLPRYELDRFMENSSNQNLSDDIQFCSNSEHELDQSLENSSNSKFSISGKIIQNNSKNDIRRIPGPATDLFLENSSSSFLWVPIQFLYNIGPCHAPKF